MRIALLTSFFPPQTCHGIAKYIDDLAIGLSEHGHNVVIFAQRRNKPQTEKRFLFTIQWTQKYKGFFTKYVPSLGLIISSFCSYKALMRSHKSNPYDIIEYPNDGITGLATLLLGLGKQRPIFVTRLSSPRAIFPKKNKLHRITETLESWQTNLSDGIISNTEANLKLCTNIYNIPQKKPKIVISHSIQTEGMKQETSVTSDDTYHVLFVGRMEKRKGFDVLAASWPAIIKSIPNARLLVVGQDLPYKKNISFFNWSTRKIPKKCLSTIDYLGMVNSDQLLSLYKKCHVCVVPSRYESFGLVILEAMRFGKPVVGCRVGGIPEVIADNKTGILVPKDDPLALKQAVIKILRDEKFRKELGQQAIEEIKIKFSPEKFIAQTISFYCSLLTQQ